MCSIRPSLAFMLKNNKKCEACFATRYFVCTFANSKLNKNEKIEMLDGSPCLDDGHDDDFLFGR